MGAPAARGPGAEILCGSLGGTRPAPRSPLVDTSRAPDMVRGSLSAASGLLTPRHPRTDLAAGGALLGARPKGAPRGEPQPAWALTVTSECCGWGTGTELSLHWPGTPVRRHFFAADTLLWCQDGRLSGSHAGGVFHMQCRPDTLRPGPADFEVPADAKAGQPEGR